MKPKQAIFALTAAAVVVFFALGASASAQEGTFRLDVKIDGKGHVQSSPGGIDCPKDCSADFESFSLVTLTENPAPGWEFVGWDGCNPPSDSGPVSQKGDTSDICEVFMDDDHTVTAKFREKPPPETTKPLFPLTVTVIGSGSVASNPAGINCGGDCAESYPQGTLVTLAPFQNATNFVKWGGDCSGSGLCSVTMTGPRSVTATFVARGSSGPETQPQGDHPDTGNTGQPYHLMLPFTCLSVNEFFVLNLYEDLLGRAADPTAFGLFVPQLDSGTPPANVALAVLQSIEYRTILVRSFYQSFLHRQPSPEELVAGLALLGGGARTEDLEALILGSEDYFASRGGSTADGFLTALFSDLLGRAPTAAERTLLGGLPRNQVARQILTSTEYRTKLINGWFQQFLGRAPTSAELATFLGMFAAGATQEQVEAAILGSPDYLAKDSSYKGTIDWGDGTTSPATILRTGKQCVVDGTHTYTGPGVFTVGTDVLAPDGTSTGLDHKLVITGLQTPPPGKENVRPSGTVLIKVNGKFVPLTSFKTVPLGTELDTTHGRVTLTSNDGSTGQFYEGRFRILGGVATTGGKTHKITLVVLTGGSFAACGKGGTRTTSGAGAAPKPKPKTVRHVWGNAKGNFRTKGRYASATVRGTLWRTDDLCNGTLVHVNRGIVDVFDLVLHKHFLVRPGKSHLALAKH